MLIDQIKHWGMTGALLLLLSSCGGSGSSSDSSASASNTGQGGSMARFSLIGDYLYTIDGSKLQLFDVTDVAQPQVFASVRVDFGIETLFATDQYLFIGGQRGMYIYDRAIPSNPRYIAEFTHAQTCDPVVVSGDYAYVTLRSGRGCGGGPFNTLEVVDISDIKNPELVDSVVMYSPKGLGVDATNQRLYVCDSQAGLKVFDLSDPGQPTLVDGMTESGVNCLDIIVASDNRMVVSNNTSIIQYDLAWLPLRKLSEITGFTAPM